MRSGAITWRPLPPVVGPAVEPFHLQNAAHRERRLDHKLPRHAFARIEIEHQLIGALVIIHRRRAVHAAPGLMAAYPDLRLS